MPIAPATSCPNESTGTLSCPLLAIVKSLAASDLTQACFAQHWLEFGFGKSLDDGDACTKEAITNAFRSTGGNIKQLLVALTQTDAFLYLPAKD